VIYGFIQISLNVPSLFFPKIQGIAGFEVIPTKILFAISRILTQKLLTR